MNTFSARWRANPWRVDFSLQFSRIFLVLVLLVHGLALFAVTVTDIHYGWCFLLWGAILLSSLWACYGVKDTQNTVVREQIGRWWVEQKGYQGAAELLGYHVWRYLVVMRFCCWQENGKAKRIRVIVWPDAVSPDTFRRLRVRLRYGTHLMDNDI